MTIGVINHVNSTFYVINVDAAYILDKYNNNIEKYLKKEHSDIYKLKNSYYICDLKHITFIDQDKLNQIT